MNPRSLIVKMNVDSTKNSGIREKRTVVNNTELIYAPVCCKIDLSNKKSCKIPLVAMLSHCFDYDL